MVLINLDEIPKYLRLSKLYDIYLENRINGDETDNIIFIPDEYIEKKINIKTFEDLVHHIVIFKYWMIYKIPYEFYDWIFENKNMVIMNLLNKYFPNLDILIKNIQIIVSSTESNICDKAANYNSLEILKYACEKGCNLMSSVSIIAAHNKNIDILKYIC